MHLILIGGRGHQHSEGKRNNSIDTQTTFKTSEDLIQSRSIDHLLCGDDGNRTLTLFYLQLLLPLFFFDLESYFVCYS